MKLDSYRFRALGGVATLGLALGAVAFAAPPARADASAPARVAQAGAPGAPVAAPSVGPNASIPPYGAAPLGAGQPTPFPQVTLGPLTGQTSLPYPAYGTPVPGVNAGTPVPGVSASITLPQAILVAFARNPALQIARDDVAVQAAEVRLERAGLLPNLSAAASVDRSHSQGGSGGVSTSTGTTTGTTGTTTGTTVVTTTGPYSLDSAGFSATLTQLIFDGGRIAAGVAAARSGEAAQADTYRRELQTIAYNVATAYYNYLAAERTTQVDLELVKQDVVQENLVRAQVRAGTEASAEIATVELPTAQARLAVVRAQGSELSAEAAFVNSMGLDANAKVQPIDDAPIYTNTPTSTVPVVSYDTALTRALALRPDYDANVQQVAQANSTLRAARLGLFPTLNGSATAADDSTDGSFGTFRNSNQIGVSLSVPIFDGGTTAANSASAAASLDIAKANLKTTELTVALNIKQALTTLVSSLAALVQTQQEYSTAIINVKSTQAQYRAGVTTLPLLLNAQVQLTQALADQVTAVYTLRQAEQTYLYAVGANYDPSGAGRAVSAAFKLGGGPAKRVPARR